MKIHAPGSSAVLSLTACKVFASLFDFCVAFVPEYWTFFVCLFLVDRVSLCMCVFLLPGTPESV